MRIRSAMIVLALLQAGAARAAPIAVVALDEDPATLRLQVAIRDRLVQAGQELREVEQALEAWPASPASLVAASEARTQKALEHYENLEFGQARELLKQALQLCREAMLLGDPGKLYLKLLHYLAAASFYDGAKEEARRFYADAIAHTPGESPDPRLFSPDVLTIFKKVRAASSARPGALKVTTRPSARLELDGRSGGNSPVDWPELAPGNHLLVLRRRGQPPQARWVLVPRGKTVTLTLDLGDGSGSDRFGQARAAATSELQGSDPGSGTFSLAQQLGVKGVVLVKVSAGHGQVAWAEEGRGWVKRYKGRLAEGEERSFADHFVAATGEAAPAKPDRCEGPSPDPGCPPRQTSARTPIYKRWWFWTLVGVAAGGAGVGIYFGVRESSPSWTAQVLPREMD